MKAGTNYSSRWTPFAFHHEQQRYARSRKRFNVIPAGRRSGKTELSKRRLIIRAFEPKPWNNPRYFCAAPTFNQAKRIFWSDLKEMIPCKLRFGRVSEAETTIRLINGATIQIVGLDKPERIEGSPWDGGIITEMPNVKPKAWVENIRPALMDRNGWCDIEGVPEGRNHYYKLYKMACMEMQSPKSEWGAFHWTAEEVLPLYGRANEVLAARRDMDELTYDQEMKAKFINFSGQAYYPWNGKLHESTKIVHDKKKPLILCLDFNVDPGVAVLAQEMRLPNGLDGVGCIDEIYITKNSNTPAVIRKFVDSYKCHEGFIMVYGDATGGARKSSQTEGSDWDLVRSGLKGYFGNRVWFEVPKSNPSERSRINVMNSRLKTVDGKVRLMVNPKTCPKLVLDFEGVRLLDGGSGEIDKNYDKSLTHLTDALGYYISKEFTVHDFEKKDSNESSDEENWK